MLHFTLLFVINLLFTVSNFNKLVTELDIETAAPAVVPVLSFWFCPCFVIQLNFRNHLTEEERACCITLTVFLLLYVSLCLPVF